MMRKFIPALMVLMFTVTLTAQQKNLTLQEVVLKGRSSLAPERMPQLTWVPGSDKFAFVRKQQLMAGSITDTTLVELLTVPALSAAVEAKGLKKLEAFPGLEWLTETRIRFSHAGRTCVYDLKTKEVTAGAALVEGAESNDIAPVTGHTAYTLGNDLFVLSAKGDILTVSENGTDDLVYGKSVSRDEYGISKGTFWSPQGDKLGFYVNNQSDVTTYPILELEKKPAEARMIKYPMAGMKSQRIRFGVYDTGTGKTVYLSTVNDDHYLTNIAWSPDGAYVYIIELSRATDHLWLNRYNAATGAFDKTLFEETSTKWLEPQTPIVFVSGKPDQFVYQSQRTGHNHLYLYNTNGELVRPMTHGEWDVITVAGFVNDGSKMYFTSTIDPLERQICCVDPNGRYQMLTRVRGTHNIILNKKTGHLIADYSSPTVPREISILDGAGKYVRHLLKAQNPLKDYKMGQMKMHVLKANDGVPLYCRMILPPNFDSTKTYPSITYVYNGPHVQLVTDSWLGGADLWQYYLAQEGFVVFTLDGRGSDNRGMAFEEKIHRQLGTAEIDDQLVGNDYLRSLKFIDTTRMGINGWSFGGFMTVGLMTRTPGRYAVGVAGGPVIDWQYYEIMYTERYMDTPAENPEGYEKSSLLNYVDNLKGKMMLIHGTSDDVVLWQHSLNYLKKCVDKGKQVDYFAYPGHLHNVTGPDRVHLLEKMTGYFKLHLMK